MKKETLDAVNGIEAFMNSCLQNKELTLDLVMDIVRYCKEILDNDKELVDENPELKEYYLLMESLLQFWEKL